MSKLLIVVLRPQQESSSSARSRVSNDAYRANHDAIFAKKNEPQSKDNLH